ncbi:hypothetical protein OSB04_un001309 [Centaurea solstitialis]|uniref:Replication protein A 70 kDa DNA-binding subunit B/D first OB fold domain-containing protein n=1 Tax=Centaurea solstitialis TaxID=347529 RepID=A0AA38SM04_9ASTR|nr:hypothetical protein OSB04_un001309 [Centaurea solstitialis]
MSQNTLNFIHEINTQSGSWMIKVRILHLWKQPFSLDMILMDERDTIKAKLIYTFERLLRECLIVVLSKFGVAENCGSYRIINHPCTNAGMITLIPRMTLTLSDKRILFKIKRKQFPVYVCFAMTVNKSQGQSLSRVGLYLSRPIFTHGQLYVAVSRVKSKERLKVVVCDANGETTNTTTNVVYKEVLQKM